MVVQLIWNKSLKILRGKSIRNCSISKSAKVQSGSNVIDSSFGRYSYCGYDCTIVNCAIGAFTSIADNVSIGDANHPMEWVSMSPVFYAGRDNRKKFAKHELPSIPKTQIGNDVWIGKGSMIKAGVKIGDGAVIGMGSIVTKNVDDYTIVAGSPAKIIRKRFNDSLIEQLLKTKWWDLDETKLMKYAEYITDPNLFVKMKEK